MQCEHSLHVPTSSDTILIFVQEKKGNFLAPIDHKILREIREIPMTSIHVFSFVRKTISFIQHKNHDNSIANVIFAQRIISLKRPKSISGCFSTSFSSFMLLAVFLIDDE